MKPRKPKCPCYFTVDFGRELVAYLGGDPAPIQDYWCWGDFAKQYPELRRGAEKYFEQEATQGTTGDPSEAVYWMVFFCGSSRAWAESVIERAKVGYPGLAAEKMALHCGSSQEWANGVNIRERNLVKKYGG